MMMRDIQKSLGRVGLVESNSMNSDDGDLGGFVFDNDTGELLYMHNYKQ